MIREAGFKCAECRRETSAFRLELDHVVPLHKGGEPWDRANLQVLCTDCHGEKTERDLGRERSPEERAWDAEVERLVAATKAGAARL